MHKNIIFMIIVAMLAIGMQIFLKKGIKTIGELKIASLNDLGAIILKLIQNKFIIIGLFIAACAVFLWLVVISKLDLTTAFPIVNGIIYALLFSASWIFLGENITFQKVIGVIAILAGIFIVLR